MRWRAGQKDFQKDFLLSLLLLLFHLLLISIFCAFDGARTLIDWLQIWWDGVHHQFEESLNFRRFFFALFVPPVWVQVSSFDFHILLCPPFWISCFFRWISRTCFSQWKIGHVNSLRGTRWMVTNISWMWCIVQLWKANYPVLSRRLLEQKQQLKWLQVARKRQVIMTYLKVENHHFLIASFTCFLICKTHVKPQVICVLSWDEKLCCQMYELGLGFYSFRPFFIYVEDFNQMCEVPNSIPMTFSWAHSKLSNNLLFAGTKLLSSCWCFFLWFLQKKWYEACNKWVGEKWMWASILHCGHSWHTMPYM